MKCVYFINFQLDKWIGVIWWTFPLSYRSKRRKWRHQRPKNSTHLASVALETSRIADARTIRPKAFSRTLTAPPHQWAIRWRPHLNNHLSTTSSRVPPKCSTRCRSHKLPLTAGLCLPTRCSSLSKIATRYHSSPVERCKKESLRHRCAGG